MSINHQQCFIWIFTPKITCFCCSKVRLLSDFHTLCMSTVWPLHLLHLFFNSPIDFQERRKQEAEEIDSPSKHGSKSWELNPFEREKECVCLVIFSLLRRLLGLEICGKSRWLSKIARAFFAVEAIFVRWWGQITSSLLQRLTQCVTHAI